MRTETTMEEVDGRLYEEYESKLTDALKQMREENDEQIRSTRDETEAVFNQKVSTVVFLYFISELITPRPPISTSP